MTYLQESHMTTITPASIADRALILGAALDQWAARDDTGAEPEVREAANTAMAEIDAMLRDLHAMRSRLVGEMRDSDDAAAALLAG
jgi:hypothetical protein